MQSNFKAVSFKAFVVSRWLDDFLARVESLVIGVDVGKEKLFGCVMGSHWGEYEIFHFGDDELHDFATWVEGLGVEVTTVVEPTGTYGDPLVHQLRRRNTKLRLMPAKRASDMSDVFDNVPSSFDGKAAYILARLHLIDLSEELREMSVDQRRIRARLGGLGDEQDDARRYGGKLESMLGRYWPRVTSYLSLTSITLLRVLSEIGGPEQVAQQPEKTRELMKKVGGPLLAKNKIEAVIASAHETQGVPMLEEELELLQSRAQKLLKCLYGQRDVERKLEAFGENSEEIANMTPKAGLKLSCAIVAYLGSLPAYSSAGAVEKSVGLNLAWRQSGKGKAWGIHISKRGPGIVRSLLYFMALRMIRRKTGCPYARAWYQERLKRNGGHRLKAIVALMRKLSRALYHLAQGAEYDPHKLFDTSRLEVL